MHGMDFSSSVRFWEKPLFGLVSKNRRFGFLCRSVVKYKKKRVSCLSCVHLHFGRRFSKCSIGLKRMYGVDWWFDFMIIYCPTVSVMWRMLKLCENGSNIDYLYETSSFFLEKPRKLKFRVWPFGFGLVPVFKNWYRTEIRFPHIPIRKIQMIMMIVWKIKGKIIRTVLCCLCTTIVLSYMHTHMSSSYRWTRTSWF